MLVVYDNLIDAAGVTFTHSTEVAAFPAENVAVPQPSEFFRTTVLDHGWVEADLGVVSAYRVAAAIATNGTAHRNLLKQSNTLNTTPWAKTNVTAFEGHQGNLPVGGLGEGSYIADDATSGEHKVVQTWSLPSSGGLIHTPVTVGAFVAEYAGFGITKCRIELKDNYGNYARVDIDLAAGTKSSVTTGGTNPLTSASATMVAVDAVTGSSEWYDVSLTATPSRVTASSLTVTIYMMVGGSISYSGSGDFLLIQATTLELGDSRSEPIATTTDTAALIRAHESGSPGSGWRHLVQSDKTDRDLVNWVYPFSATAYGSQPELSIHDPDNASSAIDIGRMVVGPAMEIDGNLVGFSADIEELGGQARTRGGQHYRGQHPRTGIHEFTLEYLTRAQAYGEIMQMYRALGRSTPGLFIAVENDTEYLDEFSIYGFLDGGHPIPHQIGDTWQTRFRVVEVP